MKIIIVGAGIAGLSTALSLARAGHKVTILESAHALAEVGAGVQLTPNTTRWLWKWGCKPDILAISALPESFNVIDGVTGEHLGSVSFDGFEEKYGGHYLVIHRADIHRVLHDHALKAGAELKLNSRVDQYFPDEGRLVLTNGKSYDADLVVAVDGIHSHARKFLSDVPTGTCGNGLDKSGWAAYRLMAEVSEIAENEANKDIATSHRCNCFVGDQSSVMTYKIRGANKMNLVLSHPDNVDTTDWTQARYQEEIKRHFERFGSNTQDLLHKAMSNPNCEISNWPVYMVPTLPRWTSPSGKLVLMGDAVHAMPFFLSMGVSMAAEDAAALTECLRLMEASDGRVNLAQAMKLLEDIRIPRAEMVRNASLHAGKVVHLPAGQEREDRDAMLRDNGGPSKCRKDLSPGEIDEFIYGCRFGIIDNTVRDWCYGYDVVDDVREQWQRTFSVRLDKRQLDDVVKTCKTSTS